jgi:hypothetical protein
MGNRGMLKGIVVCSVTTARSAPVIKRTPRSRSSMAEEPKDRNKRRVRLIFMEVTIGSRLVSHHDPQLHHCVVTAITRRRRKRANENKRKHWSTLYLSYPILSYPLLNLGFPLSTAATTSSRAPVHSD